MQPLRETRPTLRPLAGFAALAMLAWLAFVAALDQRMAPLSSSGLTADAEAGAPTRSAGAWGKLPLSFEANVGQAEGDVDFLARGSGYTLFLKSAEAVLALRQAAPARPERPSGAVLRMQLSGADPYAAVTGALRLLGKANYFIGNDPTRWRTDVSTYGRVLYKDIYPGIDLAYYGDQGQLEYDFLVAPGTDPSVIGLRYAGVDTMEVDSHGDLILKVAGAEIRQRKPLIYQENGDIRREVAGGYSIRGRDEIKFAVGTYDLSRPLVIDPVLVYSTYLGGSVQDEGHGIAVDSAGSAYVTGFTTSPDFPAAFAFQSAYVSARDAFVTKLNPSGNALVYSTYLGGIGDEIGFGIAVDSAGSAYVTGYTGSMNFPTAFAFQSTRACCGSDDAFVTKLNPSGTALLYSTYLGGTGSDEGNAIAVDSVGSAYVAGSTTSTNFPTAFAFQNTYGGGAVDAFVTKLNATGSALLYSTYLGGNSTDDGRAIAVDSAGSAYVTGSTDSTNFPSASANAGVNDAYVTKLSPGGTGLVYSIRLGGGGSDAGIGIALDSPGSAYVTGSTGSTDFPTASAFQNAYAGGGDAFVTKLAVVVTVGPPATLTLLPAAATNTVGQQHCVTATVKDAFGNPVVGVVVDFSVGPSAPTTFPTPSIGAGTTNGNGQATFCYTAALPGDDAIHAFADSNNNGMQDLAEPFGDATKTWTPPQSTQLCEVTITDGGWIIADNGDRANFAANAKVLPDGTLQGQQQYRDQGPAEPIDVHSTEITATTCSSDRTTASIFGKATIDGSGSHVFRIDVTDVGSGGTDDTYGIMLDTGYMSGQHVLSGGNVTIH